MKLTLIQPRGDSNIWIEILLLLSEYLNKSRHHRELNPLRPRLSGALWTLLTNDPRTRLNSLNVDTLLD